MSKLLIDDRPIMFLPKLAIVLESCERAIILQQIHWLLQQPNSGKVVDGYKWVWGSYEEWCRDYFPMWKPQNLAKHIRRLEKDGFVVSAELNAAQHDHTKHYRIDYTHSELQSIVYSSIVSEQYNNTLSIEHGSTASINRSETPSENTAKDRMRPLRAHREEKKNYRPDEYSDIILG